MLAKEREVQKIEDKAAEDLKIKQSLEAETQNVNKYSSFKSLDDFAWYLAEEFQSYFCWDYWFDQKQEWWLKTIQN